MVHDNIQKNCNQSTKINPKWYLQRLKTSNNHHMNCFNDKYSKDTIRVVKGTTATQGLHIPTILLTSKNKSFQIQSNTNQVFIYFCFFLNRK